MNKQCFRLVFSRPLGFLIPVAEVTPSRRKPGQQTTPSLVAAPLDSLSFSLKPLVLSLLLASAPSWSVAEIRLDPRYSNTNVITAPNGVPVIEIADPNRQGLSHNRFTEFDVAQPGVIFNNSLVNGTSQLGGAVLRNPNLSRTARAILSEVTGNKPSSISGTLEVFGDKADILIAKGFSSMDEYFSSADDIEKKSDYYRFAQGLLTEEASKRNTGYAAQLKSVIYNSNVNFDFVDSGRLYVGVDDRVEFAVRNFTMAQTLNNDLKFKLPGVLGIFGEEHLKTYPANNGVEESALQQLIGIPEERTYFLSSRFHDFETGEGYYPWSTLSDKRSEHPAMSHFWPYKPRGRAEQLMDGDTQQLFTLRNNLNHIVLNAVGGHANAEIDRIGNEHPSTTIVFDALEGGRLNYVSGPSTTEGSKRLAKVFMFTEKDTLSSDANRWVRLAGVKMGRDPNYFRVKEFLLTPQGQFQVFPTQPAPIEINTSAGPVKPTTL